MPRIMALDIGLKRTGIAITDSEQIIATGLTTILTKDLSAFLTKYLSTEMIKIIVVGMPKNLNNTPSESASFVKQTIDKLRNQFLSITWLWEDERFTSKLAYRSMKTAGAGKKEMKNKSTVDMLSAVIILQSYLERNKQQL